MSNSEIWLKERTAQEKEAYYQRIAVENVVYRSELRKLNDAILRKNHSISALRSGLDKAKRNAFRLKELLNSVWGQVDSNTNYSPAPESWDDEGEFDHLNSAWDSENPDMGKASK